jgi:hypothetical protein
VSTSAFVVFGLPALQRLLWLKDHATVSGNQYCLSNFHWRRFLELANSTSIRRRLGDARQEILMIFGAQLSQGRFKTCAI